MVLPMIPRQCSSVRGHWVLCTQASLWISILPSEVPDEEVRININHVAVSWSPVLLQKGRECQEKMLCFGNNKQGTPCKKKKKARKELPGDLEAGLCSRMLLISVGPSQVEAQVRAESNSEVFS